MGLSVLPYFNEDRSICFATETLIQERRHCCNFSTEQILILLSQFTISHILSGYVQNQWAPVQSSLGAVRKYLALGIEVKPTESGNSPSSSAALVQPMPSIGWLGYLNCYPY